ncbi:folylpolyglutamate synthase/dihydrofolate synthase family protein [Rossellomorea marisflavi]|uniref:bifunctional folylpolyglutamate synthase/dihydrofolate synthase n=1 Tax=Rossellomorea marisflavi TaxID=189381 RepID=UPI00207B0B99|nr:folylpolyglutamate synthase/dihydrofolate synthase family protein [Rossellomorea marisflavi]USK90973.1 bifunctional folylpolyglutamate synthase/dihydrofolate synthase [Rossellomorea marisflavi]
MMQYEDAVNWIHSRLRLGIKPGLQRMEELLEKLGNPHQSIRTVHIGGTNGKGSTVTFLRNILEEAGYTVGTFTSPYFERFNERISMNGVPISDESLTKLVERVKPIAEEMEDSEWGGPSEFEVITAMNFLYFAEYETPDIVLEEVGLGGRLDSTNVINPLVSVITSIGMDHMQFLGNSLEEIAFEKAGIIKPGVPVVSGVSQPEAAAVISEQAEQKHSQLHVLGEGFTAVATDHLPDGERFRYEEDGASESFDVTMIGMHQVRNAAVSIKVAVLLGDHGFRIDSGHVKRGLMKAYWPGRMEKVSDTPLIFLDGAHNPEGVAALVKTIQERFEGRHVNSVFAALKDKDLKPMIEPLSRAVDTLVLTQFDFPRAASGSELLELAGRGIVADDWKEYVDEYIASMREGEVLLITGSLYFLSEVKPYLSKKLENNRINK